MDFGQTPRLGAIPTAPVPRADIVATTGAVSSVELPPDQTVQSAPAGAGIKLDVRGKDLQQRAEAVAARNEALRRDMPQSNIERRLVVEPRTRTVILQRLDADTGEVVETIPDEATLRQRLYARSLAQAEAEAKALDRKA